jgi:hypothetical protein
MSTGNIAVHFVFSYTIITTMHISHWRMYRCAVYLLPYSTLFYIIFHVFRLSLFLHQSDKYNTDYYTQILYSCPISFLFSSFLLSRWEHCISSSLFLSSRISVLDQKISLQEPWHLIKIVQYWNICSDTFQKVLVLYVLQTIE